MSNTIAALGMVVIDLIIIILSIKIIKLNTLKWTKAVKVTSAILGVLIAVSYIILFAKEYLYWNNFNAALFVTIKPWFSAIVWLIGVFVFAFVEKRIFAETKHESSIKDALITCASVTLSLLFSLYIMPFAELYINNKDEIGFSILNFLLPLFGVIIAITGVVFYICILLNESARRVFLSVLWSVTIMSYFQGALLNSKLFVMDGKEMDWSLNLIIGNLLIWIITCGLLVIAINHKKLIEYSKKIFIYSSWFLILIQLAGIISLVPKLLNEETNRSDKETNYFTTEGINEIADEGNVVVFVLDTYDVDFYDEVLSVDANFYRPLRDFVYYPDCISQFSRTYPSIPYMLSHRLYFYEETKKDYVDLAFKECKFWSELSQKGYSIYMYEDDKQCVGEALSLLCSNFNKEGHVISEDYSFGGMLKAINLIGLYRQLPYFAKNSFLYTADMINSLVIIDKEWDIPPYLMNDAKLIESMRGEGLEVSSDTKAFRFIHLMGAHAPYTLDSYGNEVTNRNISPVEQYQGCMQYIFSYIEELRRLNKYDEATIIVTADHGKNFAAERMPNRTNPIMLIKYPESINVEGNISKKENGPGISDRKTSLEDILPTIAGVLELDYDSEGIGEDLTKEIEENRIRYHYYTVVENTNQTGTLKYEIKGNSCEFSSWENTGDYCKFGDYYE